MFPLLILIKKMPVGLYLNKLEKDNLSYHNGSEYLEKQTTFKVFHATIDTQRRFNVYKTSIQRRRRCKDIL